MNNINTKIINIRINEEDAPTIIDVVTTELNIIFVSKEKTTPKS